MRFLINALTVKKFSGGAFQIANNFILESLKLQDIEWYYLVSSDLDAELSTSFNQLKDSRYFVFPSQPDLLGTYLKVRKQVEKLEDDIKPDLVYSICAPSYFHFKAMEVMRCTDPWVTHPNKYARGTLNLRNRIYYTLHVSLDKWQMRKCHYFVTQTETCKKGILKVTAEPNSHVKVVPNVLPAIFNTVDKTPIKNDEYIDVVSIGNPVPHKNFDIIPEVLNEMRNKGYNNVRFHVTMPSGCEAEKSIVRKAKELGFEKNIINHGRVTQQELSVIYRQCKLCFLPTLLEVFSASTVEAMFFDLPIVATDFDFNREITGDGCLYYKPMNSKDAAEKMIKLLDDQALYSQCVEKMRCRLNNYSNYTAHFNSIKDFLVEVSEGKLD